MKQIVIKCEVGTMEEAKETAIKFEEIMKSLTSSGPSLLEITVTTRK